MRSSECLQKKRLARWSSLILIFFVFFNLNIGCFYNSALASEKRVRKPKVKRAVTPVTEEASLPPILEQESFLELVKEYLGTPYRWGGATKKGMDCSGFVRHVYSKTFSLDLPHSSFQQHSHPTMKKVPSENLRTGDLIFFSQNGKRINHVGIYLEDGNFIHSARKKGVIISSLDKQYWKVRMVCAKRPAGVWRFEESDRARSLSGGDTASKDFGNIFHRHTGTQTGDLSVSEGLRPLSWEESSYGSDLREGLTHTFGFQVSHSLGDASWSMSLLQESRLPRYAGGEGINDFLIPRPTYALSEPRHAMDTNLQGLKMAGEIHPFDWLHITPSFSYVGYESGVEESPSWGPGLGLAIRIKPLPARWSFSAALQYWDESDRLSGGSNEIDNWNSSNLSLKFGYDLSNDLRLSIVGQHGMGRLFSVRESRSEDYRKHNGLFLGLDWAF